MYLIFLFNIFFKIIITDWVNSVFFLSGMKYIISGSSDNSIGVWSWSMDDMKDIKAINGHKGETFIIIV